MKAILGSRFFALAASILAVGSNGHSQDAPKHPELLVIDIDRPGGAVEIELPGPGAMIQFVAQRPKGKKEPRAIQNLRVEITGNSVENLGVAKVPDHNIGMRLRQENYSCFVRSVKNGVATVKITPIGPNGRVDAPTEWTIRVGFQKKDRNDKDPKKDTDTKGER